MQRGYKMVSDINSLPVPQGIMYEKAQSSPGWLIKYAIIKKKISLKSRYCEKKYKTGLNGKVDVHIPEPVLMFAIIGLATNKRLTLAG